MVSHARLLLDMTSLFPCLRSRNTQRFSCRDIEGAKAGLARTLILIHASSPGSNVVEVYIFESAAALVTFGRLSLSLSHGLASL